MCSARGMFVDTCVDYYTHSCVKKGVNDVATAGEYQWYPLEDSKNNRLGCFYVMYMLHVAMLKTVIDYNKMYSNFSVLLLPNKITVTNAHGQLSLVNK